MKPTMNSLKKGKNMEKKIKVVAAGYSLCVMYDGLADLILF